MLMGLWGSRHSDIVLLDVDNGPTSMENSIGLAGGANAGDVGSIPGSGRSPGGANGSPLLCLPRESHGQRSLAGYSPWGHRVGQALATKQQ